MATSNRPMATPQITMGSTAEIFRDDPRRQAFETRIRHIVGAQAITLGVVTSLRICAKKYNGDLSHMTPTKIANEVGWDTNILDARAFAALLVDCGFMTREGMAIFDDWRDILEKASNEESFGSYLRRLRMAKYADDRLSTMAYVADCCDISSNFLGELERGVKSPSLATISRLANYFDIPYEEMRSKAQIGREKFSLVATHATYNRIPRSILANTASRLEESWPVMDEHTAREIDAALDRMQLRTDLFNAAGNAHTSAIAALTQPKSPAQALKDAKNIAGEMTLAQMAAQPKPTSKAKSGPNKGKK